MARAKEVVDLTKELGVGANAQPQAKPKKFRFKKLQFPVQPVILGNGKRVTFQQVKLNTGGNSHWGMFETEDASLAEQLRALNGSQYVREV